MQARVWEMGGLLFASSPSAHRGGLATGVLINAMGVPITEVSGMKVHLPTFASLGAGVRGDGRCLFRAVAYGHNMQERKGAQDSHQDEQQADLLRNLVRPLALLAAFESMWKLIVHLDALGGPSY
jgi:hypothetical protein